MPHPTTAHPPLTPLHFTYSSLESRPNASNRRELLKSFAKRVLARYKLSLNPKKHSSMSLLALWVRTHPTWYVGTQESGAVSFDTEGFSEVSTCSNIWPCWEGCAATALQEKFFSHNQATLTERMLTTSHTKTFLPMTKLDRGVKTPKNSKNSGRGQPRGKTGATTGNFDDCWLF